ncbi:AAA family ATPase [Kutzneria albida]|uniref:HTH luxR-type domain-containing protein n=1 Tax=Kutzneria albida DSM 43870 TaxID=1449976 RepID=W5WNC9_9PSEU|nr:LuxR family transcriptional regulator [Kutzneria albida]AHH99654.1 hypothetical protein KALB_6294 [Kutzneria albida DSM 43870]
MDLIGRDGERAAVLGLTSGVLLLTGEPGAGKSSLLDLAAGDTSRRVLRVTGTQDEADLPYAGLHQLLHPVLAETAALPRRQREALHGAFGLTDHRPDRLLIGIAVLALLSELGPLLVVADDVQWLDQGTRAVLAFVGRRVEDEPLALLLAARAETGFAEFPTLPLGPLDELAANELLDRQPNPPVGRQRLRVLALAAGNPLALVELARVDSAEDLLPLPERLERIFAADLAALPAHTRHALLLAATDTADLVATRYAAELAPAERAGLLHAVGGRLRFRHPLIRSAVHHAAPLDTRRRAHLELAELLAAEPDRRAWHLASAAVSPDEPVAQALEDTASRARQRGGHAAAATALERAAELSPDPHERARRFVLAAGDAVATGQAPWVEALATRVGTLTGDPTLLALADLRLGQVLTVTSRHESAVDVLLRAAACPEVAEQALASAAVACFYSGDEPRRRRVHELAAGGDPWTRALTDPLAHREELTSVLPELVERAAGDPQRLTAVGAMAWMVDETALAVRIFDDALHRWRARGELPTVLDCSAGWAYLDHGDWAQARLAASNAAGLAANAKLGHLSAALQSLQAGALALQGEVDQARRLAQHVLATIQPGRSRAVATRARWALGMAAVASGDHEAAWEQFRAVFTAAGDPVHYHMSPPAIAELAAAAVRTGHQDEAAEVLARTQKRFAGATSPRMHALIRRARALLHNEEPDFLAALGDPATTQWPFERAQVLLDHAEWLRRQRRILDARPRLAEALEVFQRLGARPWIARAQAELRAAGVESPAAAAHAVTELTPQQQQIVRLAASGLSNREIGERLFLSPRTVGSHLYRSFPKLGVTARSQLRDLVV